MSRAARIAWAALPHIACTDSPPPPCAVYDGGVVGDVITLAWAAEAPAHTAKCLLRVVQKEASAGERW